MSPPTRPVGWEEGLYYFLKVANCGVPTLLYGLVSLGLLNGTESIKMSTSESVDIYFLYPSP